MAENKYYDIDIGEKKAALVTWVSSLIIYRLTMAPAVIWGDSAGLSIRVHDFLLDPASDGHPLYIVLGKLFSFLPGELAVDLNFMSVVFASFAVLFVFLIVKNITKNNIAAFGGAIAFQFSHAFWLHAVMAEVYALNAFFLASIIYLMLRWKDAKQNDKYLLWAALVFGLSLSHHLVLALFAFPVLYFLFAYEKSIYLDWRRFSKLIYYFLAGLSLFIVIFAYWYFTYSSKETVQITAGREHAQYMLRFPIGMVLKNIAFYLAYQMYQFPILGFYLGWLGVREMFSAQRKICVFLFSIILINAAFFIGFVNLYQTSNYTFYISDYMVFSLFIGFGLYSLIIKWQEKKRDEKKLGKSVSILLVMLCLLPVSGYTLTPLVSQFLGVNLLGARDIEYRNNEWFFLFPPKTSYDGALRFGTEALEGVEPGATIIADYTPCAVLEYLQKVKGMRPDVKVIDVNDASEGSASHSLRPFVDENFAKGPIYLADMENKWYYNIEDFPPDYELIKKGIIFLVTKKRTKK